MENQEQSKNSTTYGVRLQTETKDKLTKIIAESGLPANEFFSNIIALYQTHSEDKPIRSEVADITKYLKLIGQRVESLASVADVMESEKEELVNAHADQLGKSFDELTIAKQESDGLKTVIADLQKDIETLKKQHDQEVLELQTEIKRLKSLEELVGDIRRMFAEAQREADLYKTKADRLTEQLEGNKDVIQTLTIDKERLETKLEMTIQQLEEKKAELQSRSKQAKPSPVQPVVANEIDERLILLKEQGMTHQEIADLLNSEGIATVTGRLWNSDNVKKRVSTIKQSKQA